MPDDEKTRQRLLSELEGDIQYHWDRHRAQGNLQWVLTIAMAVAGGLTTAAGVQGVDTSLLTSSNALILWGVVAAVGAGVTQKKNPGAKSERHLSVKLALKQIRLNLDYDNISVGDAARIHAIAVNDPDGAANELQLEIQRRRELADRPA